MAEGLIQINRDAPSHLRARVLPPPTSAASGGAGRASSPWGGRPQAGRVGGCFRAHGTALVSSNSPQPSSTAARSMPPSPHSLRSRDKTSRRSLPTHISDNPDTRLLPSALTRQSDAAALGFKISKTTPCTVAGQGTWRSLAHPIPQRQFDSSGKSPVLFDNSEIHSVMPASAGQDRTASPAATMPLVRHHASRPLRIFHARTRAPSPHLSRRSDVTPFCSRRDGANL